MGRRAKPLDRKKILDNKPRKLTVTSTQKKRNQAAFAKQQLFLAAYVKNNGHRTKSAEEAGIGVSTFYAWLRDDPDFPAMLAEAEEQFVDQLREAGLRRAKEHSDNLLKFFLAAERPETYDDAIRKLVWMKKNGAVLDPEGAVMIKLVDGNTPEKDRNFIPEVDGES